MTEQTPAPRKKSWLKRILLGLLILIVVVVVLLYFTIDGIVKWGVIRASKQATQQDTTLSSAALHIFGGNVKLTDLEIANPQGYANKQFLTVGNTSVTVQIGSLMTNDVNVDEILLDNVEVDLEQNGLKNNLNDILAAVNANTAAAGNANTPPGKNIHVAVIRISSTKVHLAALPGVPAATVDLGPIEIKDPTNPDGRPTKIADIIGKCLIHIGSSIANNKAIGDQFKAGLKNAQAILDSAGKDLQNVIKNPGDVGKGINDIGKNVGDLLNGGNKKK